MNKYKQRGKIKQKQSKNVQIRRLLFKKNNILAWERLRIIVPKTLKGNLNQC